VPFDGRSGTRTATAFASSATTTFASGASATTSSTASPSSSATTAPRVREVDVNVQHVLLATNALRVLGHFVLIIFVVIITFALLAQLVHFLPLAGVLSFAGLPDVELRLLVAAAQRLPLIQRQFLQITFLSKKLQYCSWQKQLLLMTQAEK
jgi:hypothetical protein